MASEVPALRAAFAGQLAIGAAVGGRLPGALSDEERATLLQHVDVLTPENCMKPGPVHPEPERYDFELGDALVAFAERHGRGVVGHCLAWHQQCPEWLFAGTSKAESLAQLERHIHGVAGRYRGRIHGWDVVNEAVADGGADDLRDTPALRAMGAEYIARAFTFASEADPHAELYYNDFNIELPDKRERTLRLLDRILRSGARIDGVGIQGHWMLDRVPFDALRQSIAAYRALGLKVMITELDLDVVERPDCGADVSVHRAYAPAEDIYADGCPEAVLQRQAEQYGRLFEIFTEEPGAVTRVSFWGLHDGKSWLNHWPGRRTNHPLLFDRSLRPKPAFWRVLEVAQSAARR